MSDVKKDEVSNDIKVLELCDAFYPVVDGVVAVVKNYAKNINKTDKCSVAAPAPRKKDKYVDSEEFEVIRCRSVSAPEKYRYGLPSIDRKFKKKVARAEFDVLHAHSPFSMGRFALHFAKKKKVPLVVTLHTQYHQDFARVLKSKVLTRMMIKYIMKVFNHADSVWTVSEASKKYLRLYGYKGDIQVVRNGTEYVYPDNAQELISAVNSEHNLDGQKNVFLFVGRMAMYKNLGLICDALKILKEKNKDFKMLWVGGGFDIDELKKIVNKYGLSENCIFTGSINDRKKLQGYYLRSDVFLFPSTFDMASVSKVEAAVHKIPSVVVRGSCSAEQVVDGVNGFLCEDDANDLADKLVYICDNPEKVKEAGENAYKTLSRSWKDVADEALEKYKEIVKNYKSKK